MVQKQERPKAISQASLSRGCATKRPILARGLAGRDFPGPIIWLSLSLKYQKSASRTAAKHATAACGATTPNLL